MNFSNVLNAWLRTIGAHVPDPRPASTLCYSEMTDGVFTKWRSTERCRVCGQRLWRQLEPPTGKST